MTMTIGVVNQKGGVGKTTTAMMVATALARKDHKVTVIDSDPQGSATEWAERAEEAGEPLPFRVRNVTVRQLSKLSPSGDFVLIDTPPANAQIIDAAIDAADRVIIPVSPSGMEVAKMWDTYDLVKNRGGHPRVLLTSVNFSAKSSEELKASLKGEDVDLCTTWIPQREALRKYFGHMPGADLFGYGVVADWLIEERENV